MIHNFVPLLQKGAAIKPLWKRGLWLGLDNQQSITAVAAVYVIVMSWLFWCVAKSGAFLQIVIGGGEFCADAKSKNITNYSLAYKTG